MVGNTSSREQLMSARKIKNDNTSTPARSCNEDILSRDDCVNRRIVFSLVELELLLYLSVPLVKLQYGLGR